MQELTEDCLRIVHDENAMVLNKICGCQSCLLYLYALFHFFKHKSIIMEHQQDSSLFGMSVDQAGKAHLAEAARWAKFLSVMGFIGCGLVVLIGVFFDKFFNTITSGLERTSPYGDVPPPKAFGAAMGFVYIVVALIYFFPCLFLFRFATKMKTALASNDQETLNTSFQNLKATFRFIGIVTLIGLCFWVLAFIVSLLGAATGGRM